MLHEVVAALIVQSQMILCVADNPQRARSIPMSGMCLAGTLNEASSNTKRWSGSYRRNWVSPQCSGPIWRRSFCPFPHIPMNRPIGCPFICTLSRRGQEHPPTGNPTNTVLFTGSRLLKRHN